jgi:hypothetical protein
MEGKEDSHSSDSSEKPEEGQIWEDDNKVKENSKKRERCDDCDEKSKKKKISKKNAKPRDNTLNDVVKFIRDRYNESMEDTPVRAFKNIPMHNLRPIFEMSKWGEQPGLYQSVVGKYIKQNVKALTCSTNRILVWQTDTEGNVLKDSHGDPIPQYVADSVTGKTKLDKKTGKPVQRRRVAYTNNGRTINIVATEDDKCLAELWIHKNLFIKSKSSQFTVNDNALVSFNNLGESIKHEVLNMCGSFGIKEGQFDKLKSYIYIPCVLNPKVNDRSILERYGLNYKVTND